MHLDFNHKSSKREAISDAINKYIDIGLNDRLRSEKPHEFNVSPSLIGEECQRKIQYTITGVPQNFSGQTLRIFERGHVFEQVAIEWMRLGGFVLDDLAPDGKQHGFSTGGGNIRGRLDAIVRDGIPIPGLTYPFVWDCKVLGDKGFNNVKKQGTERSHPKYFAQFQMYQAYMQLENTAVMTTVNANTMELFHETVEFNPEAAQRVSDKSVDILLATQHGQLLERIGGSPDDRKCLYCDFVDHCWNGIGKLGPKRPK